MLQPSTQWYWYIDTQSEYLCISLDRELCFTTPYHAKSVFLAQGRQQAFSLADLDHYAELADCLEQSCLALSAAELTQILLNAAAALAFHRPLAAKSWYFTSQQNSGEFHRLATLQNEYSEGLVVVLFREGPTATCILLSNQLQLDDNKHLHQFQLIKVMSDRLQAYIPTFHQQKSA
jgi:cell division protein ZapC